MRTKIASYSGSLDHSPSEQLHRADQWHTTVLVLSQGNEHWRLASDIAQRIGYPDGSLRKWSGSRSLSRERLSEYRSAFERIFAERALAFPVHIRAISARARTIDRCWAELANQLQLAGLVRSIDRHGKPYIEFGPFTRVFFGEGFDEHGSLRQQTEPASFQLHQRQAAALIFIAYFLIRTHQQLVPLVKRFHPDLEWIDWFIMPNKFPGGVFGPMGQLFHAVMSGAAHAHLVAGNIRVSTLVHSKDDHGSTLADNIAGLLRQKIETGSPLRTPIGHGLEASISWDSWEQDAPSQG